MPQSQYIQCAKCAEGKPEGVTSPYPGEYQKVLRGAAKTRPEEARFVYMGRIGEEPESIRIDEDDLICDLCNALIPVGEPCAAVTFSLSPTFEAWEEAYIECTA
jgi:hypothetical protein